MMYYFALLALAVLSNANLFVSNNQAGVGASTDSDISSDSDAFRIRRRDLLRQGYKLTVEAVKPITTEAVDQGEFLPFSELLGLAMARLRVHYLRPIKTIYRHLRPKMCILNPRTPLINTCQ
jgi:hypothetical protein